MKRFLFLFFATIFILGFGCFVSASETEELFCGTSVTVNIVNANEVCSYAFTPNDTAMYEFISYNETCDVNIKIFDSSNSLVASDDDSGDGTNFALRLMLEKENTYKIEISAYPYETGKADIIVEKIKTAQSVSIKGNDEITGFLGKKDNHICLAESSDVYVPATWSVSDESIAEITNVKNEYGESTCYVEYLSVGEVTITATLPNGASDSIKVNVIEHYELILNEEVNIQIENNREVYFVFKAEESGYHEFIAGSDKCMFGSLYDSSNKYIVGNYISSGGFSFIGELKAGETYKLKISACDDNTTSANISVVKHDQAEKIYFEKESMDVYVDSTIVLSCLAENSDEFVKATWSISDESVAKLLYIDNNVGFSECDFNALTTGNVTVTATLENGYSASIIINVIPPAELSLQDPFSINIEPRKILRFQFTPESDGLYNFYATSELYLGAELSTSDHTYIKREDNGYSKGFELVSELNAGKTYYLEVYEDYKYIGGNIDMYVEKLNVAESITFSEGAETKIFVGLGRIFTCTAANEEEYVHVTWTSSDESVIEIEEVVNSKGEASCVAWFRQPGKSTVTATLPNGMAYTVEAIALAPIPLIDNKESIYDLAVNEMVVFEIVPEKSAVYKFVSDNDFEIIAYLNDADGETLKYASYSEDQCDFTLHYFLEANKSYTIYVFALNTGDYGSISIQTTKLQEAETIKISTADNTEGYLGGEGYISCNDIGEDKYASVTWTSSDNNIVSIVESADDLGKSYCRVEYRALGTATLTAALPNGASDSIVINVVDSININKDEKIEKNTSSMNLNFIPDEDGRYYITAVGNGLRIFMYDSNGSRVGSSFITNDALKLYANLVAGEEYKIKVQGGEDTNNISLVVKKYEPRPYIYNIDMNEDYYTDTKDVVNLRRYISRWGGYKVKDVNNDGSIDGKDVVLLRRYIAGWDMIHLSSQDKEFRKKVVELVNVEREKEGLEPLEVYYEGQEAGDLRAKEITEYFSHTRPDGSSCYTACTEVGTPESACGENIAAGYRSPEAVVEGWMNSPGHRANILNSNFTHIVVGVRGYSWVQMFYRIV